MLTHPVAGRDMADLVAQHGREFGFGIDVSENAARDVDVAARQREGIDLRTVEDSEMIFEVRTMALCRQFLADHLDIGLEFRVGIHAVLFFDLAVIAVAEFDFLGLGHEHQVRCAGDGVGSAAGRETDRRGSQEQGE